MSTLKATLHHWNSSTKSYDTLHPETETSQITDFATKHAEKQDKLTFDSTPTANSTHPVTSGGVKAALDKKQGSLTFDSTPTANSTNPVTSGGIKAALDKKQGNLTFDSTPTANSTNPVTSGGVKAALDKKQAAGYYLTASGDDNEYTVDEFYNRHRETSGGVGSVQIKKKDTGIGSEIVSGWYNYIYMPHRNGIGGDNANYASVILCPMDHAGFSYLLRWTNKVLSDCKVLTPSALKNPAALTFTGGASGSYDGSSAKSVAIPVVPSALKNPAALTFTGGASGSYDGSSAKSVAIPVIPSALKNPAGLTFTGSASGTYDGSKAMSVTIPDSYTVNYTGGRISSANVLYGDGKLRYLLATREMTEGKPVFHGKTDDGFIVHFSWDNKTGWDTQLAIESITGEVVTRSQNKGIWGEWLRMLNENDLSDINTAISGVKTSLETVKSEAGVVAGDVSNPDAWWVKLGGTIPLIIQGGISATGNVTFPIAFPSVVFAALTNVKDYSGDNRVTWGEWSVTSLSKTGFTTGQGQRARYWVSLGY